MALKANLVIDQGTDFSTSINVTNDDGDVVDLTGYTAAAQMRKHYTSSNAYSFVTSVNEIQGIVTISMTANTTGSIAAGRYVYDCELTSNTNVITRLVEGIVTVTPQVTR